MIATAALHRQSVLKRLFFSSPHRIFGLVDFACDPALYETLEPHLDRMHCLYDGMAQIRLARYAPYIYEVNPQHPAFQLWADKGVGRSWGIFMQTTLSLPPLALHLRKFLFSRDRSGQLAYFRFYDPQVMRDLIDVLQDQQNHALFHPIDAVIAEAGGHCITRYGFQDSVLGGRRLSIENYDFGGGA